MDAFAVLCRTEGIIPAIESANALAGTLELGRELGPEAVILVNLSKTWPEVMSRTDEAQRATLQD